MFRLAPKDKGSYISRTSLAASKISAKGKPSGEIVKVDKISKRSFYENALFT
jgi:hypothetical protein